MENAPIKRAIRFSLFVIAVGFSTVLFSQSALQIDTTLTDQYNDGSPGEAKDTFTKDTSTIYIIWKSNQLKQGQKIKSVWIAEDTHNIAPPNYKIDEAQLTLDEGLAGSIISHLPGNVWNGKFTLSKPNNGWPAGKYHTDIYVDDALVKTVNFTIADATPTPTPAPSTSKKESGNWGAIAADTASHDKDCAYGVGAGDSKEEAEKYAQKYCKDAGGEQCGVVISYQQCGAYALSKTHEGIGSGATKEASEQMAKSKCNDTDCTIITSDCNS